MNPSAVLPPVIRVFLSSTFADMQKERNYFNMVLQPKLREMCETRGVSFFSVDLRWGITKEEQMDGKVLPICLSEIDKCRPYFIGMIGNRYGSVVREITENMTNAIPWLAGKEGKSITELEMLYGVLDEERRSGTQNSAFYFRSQALSEALSPQDEPEPEALKRLKETVKNHPEVHSEEYGSLEQFGELILRDFRVWIDREYPAASVAADARKNWYNAEFRRNYVDLPQMRQFLDYYLAHDRKPLMITGEGKRGKTAFLTNWALDRERCILINCRSDSAFNYWPSIAHEIVRELLKLEPEAPVPDFSADATLAINMFGQRKAAQQEDGGAEQGADRYGMYFVTEKDRDSFREGFVKWMSGLSLDRPAYVVINDLEMLDDGDARLLTWLPSELPENLRLICSCSDPEMVDNARILSWNLKELPLFPEESAEVLLARCLKDFGKGLSPEQKNAILASPLADYPGCLKYIVSFLCRFGVRRNLPEMTARIHDTGDMAAMFGYSCEIMLADLTEEERAEFMKLLSYLRCNTDALLEQDYYSILSSEKSVPAILWSRFRNILEQLDLVKGEYWEMNDRDLSRFVDSMGIDAPAAQLTLGRFYLQRLRQERPYVSMLENIRFGTENAKYALRHLKASGDPEALIEGLTDGTVLYYLCKIDWHIERSGWMQLVLDSDADVPALIRQTIDENRDKTSDSGLICRRLEMLLPDLEYRRQASELLGQPEEEVHGELYTQDADNTSPGFVRIYNDVVGYKSAGKFREMAILIKAAFSNLPGLSDRERSKLLALKADAELNLKLTEAHLKTCAENYFTAIKTADLSLICEALLSYGHGTYFAGDYAKAREILEKTKRFAMLNGELRTWLSANNVDGMCCYRMEEFDTSLQLFEQCLNTWKKVGNDREVGSVCLNISNLHYLKGDSAAATRVAEETVEMLARSDSEKARRLIPQILGNIGQYRMGAQDSEGEETLLQALAELEKSPSAGAAINARSSLAEFYWKKGQNVKAAEQYEALANLHFGRGEYSRAARAVRRLSDSLVRARMDERRREICAKWEAAFAAVPNGMEYFREEMGDAAPDQIRISQLEELLVVARAEGDLRKAARLQTELFGLLYDTDKDRAFSCLAEAAGIHRQLGNTEECRWLAEESIGLLMKEDFVDREMMDLFFSMLPPSEREMEEQWKLLYSISAKMRDGGDDSLREKFQGLTRLLISSGYPHFAVIILCDQLAPVLACCSKETVRDLIGLASKEERTKGLLRQAMGPVKDDCFKELSELFSEYHGPRAESLLRKQENLVVLLQAFEDGDAAAVAGNLAVIFRRRGEKEKTIGYHRLSMDSYEKAGSMHDYLIEKMNLSTAYREFGEIHEAVRLLREAVAEAHDHGEKMMEAAVAGNLASLLVNQPELASSKKEILELFAVEEARFLEAREYRDYVISLCNQLIYQFRSSPPDLGLMEEKLEKAKDCVRKYGLREFEEFLGEMESRIRRMR